MNQHFKTASHCTVVGSIGVAVLAALSGCEDKNTVSQADINEAKNQFLVIVENPKGTYTVTEQYPSSGPSRAVLRDISGNERVIDEAELKQLAQQEASKIEDGTSNLTKDNRQGGLSLGETILAVAGGAMLGNLVGNAISNSLRGNQNFQNRQNTAQRSSTINRSANSSPKKGTSSKKGGFFNSRGSSKVNSGFFGG